MAAIPITPEIPEFAELESRMQHYVDGGFLPCVDTVILDGTEVVHRSTHGVMSLESSTPLRDDAIFRIFSNTKIVTSIAAMILVERGLVGLDDELSAHLPEFADMMVLRPGAESIDDVEPARNPILVRHVLSHTAGLSYGFIEPFSVIDQAYMAAGVLHGSATLDELTSKAASLPLVYHPGEFWRYSVATDVTARLVEVVSGKRFSTFLSDEIFEPLGMVDTAFFVPNDKLDRFVAMYDPANLFDPSVPGLTLHSNGMGGSYAPDVTFESGGGGLVSTMSDYVTFVQMIVNGGEWNGARIVRPDTLELMRTNQCAPGVVVNFPMWSMPGTVFGLGFGVRQDVGEGAPTASVGEYFWGGMAGTHSWMSPSGRSGLCFTQVMPGFWHPFSHDFRRLAYELAD